MKDQSWLITLDYNNLALKIYANYINYETNEVHQ